MPVFEASSSSMLFAGTAVDAVTAAQPCDVSPVVSDVDLDTGGTHTLEHGTFAKVAAADAMPHLGQHDGDRAHARSPDTDDV